MAMRLHPVAILSLALLTAVPFAEQAPAFHLEDVDGHSVNLDEHLGKDVILLDFWATFCGPCLTELDTYRGMQLRHAQGLKVIAISVDQPQTVARVRSFARARAFPFSVVLDPEQQAYRLYNVSVLPTSILIDRRGKIIYRKEGFEPGDEKEMERRLSQLLDTVTVTDSAAKSPAAPTSMVDGVKGLIGNVSLSGSNFMRANYGKENPTDSGSNGWLEDWFDFRLASDRLSYQARFRDYQFLRDLPGERDNLIRDPTDRIVRQTFAYESDHADLQAGDLYGNLNRGIVLNLFEDRQARIDKDVRGAWGSLQGGDSTGWGKGRISVFGGNTYSDFTDLYTNDAEEDQLRNLYLQGLEGQWQPRAGTTVGAQYVEAFRTDWHVKMAGGNWEQLWGPTSLYLAYVGLTGQDEFNYPYDYHGRAVYGSLSENLGRLELGGEYKYYYNYDLGFTDPPSLVMYHTFRLMARDILFPNNQAEQGFQVHGTWRFHDRDFYSTNLSDILSHPERNPSLLIEHVRLPYLDWDQSLQLYGSGQANVLFDADWDRQRKFEQGTFQDVNAFSLGVTGTKPLRGPWTLQGEAEVQKRYTDSLGLVPPDAASGQLGEVGGVFGKDNPWQGVLSATLGRNSAWTFTLDYEFTTSKSEQDSSGFRYKLPGTTSDWVSAYFTYSALAGNQISLWLGQRQERVVCSGGSCRLEPAFEGAELIWNTHF